ncbi:CHAT domain-containing protein, partial [Streptomyces murinus]
AAPEASLLAGRIALALGWTADAERHLAVAARSRRGGSPTARMTGWAAQALRARAAGSRRGVLEACRHGLDVLDDHRMTLGASELRAHVTAQGAELAALAQEVSLTDDRPRRLLEWSERWRATVLSTPPTRPPADAALLSGLTAYREIAARAEESRMEGRPVPALEREQRRLEREIRSRTRHIRGSAPHEGARFEVPRLLDRLGEDRLVELAVVQGRVHVLLCGRGRVRRFIGGPLADAVAEAEYVQAGLRRLAHPGAEARLPLVEAAGARLQELLLAGAVPHLGAGPVVIVPPGALHRVPWALLPALRDRVLSVSPSAGSWLRARETEPPRDGRTVLVRGPGLATGGAEVPELADRYGTATVLEGDDAQVPRVLSELDGAGLAHLAAHGTFRADSPLFSALRMSDGPLIVHDFERLARSPYRIILSSCDTARLASVGADELLGLVTALLPLGTAGVVASSAPVNDAAVIPLMLALHKGLTAGLSLAESLRDARTTLPPDTVHQATGWAFAAFGAA